MSKKGNDGKELPRYVPTEEEIRKQTKAMQASWSKQVENSRRVGWQSREIEIYEPRLYGDRRFYKTVESD